MKIIEGILFVLGILLFSAANGNYGTICAVIGVICIGFLFACFIAGSGSGDEYVRELRKAMVDDVQTCCDQYKNQFPGSKVLIDHIREDVCHIIRSRM